MTGEMLAKVPARTNLVAQGFDPAVPKETVAVAPGRDPMTGQSRSSLIAGDPLRGNLVFWDRAGRLPPRPGNGWYGQPIYALVAPNGVVTKLKRMDPGNANRDMREYDARFYGEVQLPPDLAPGQYTLMAGQVAFVFFIVKPPAKTNNGFIRVDPGTTIETIQELLTLGFNLELAPGVYYWVWSIYGPENRPLSLLSGTTIRGSGAVIRPPADAIPNAGDEWQWCVFIANEWCVLDGLRFELLPGMRIVQGQSAAHNLTLSHCKLTPAALSEPGPGMFVQDCEISGAGAGIWTASGGLCRRIKAYDNISSHVFVSWAADGTLALIDFHWDWTDRGPIFQPSWGDIRANLFLGCWCSNVCWSENGCECFLCETTADFALDDNLILHYRYDGGPGGGAAIQWDKKARNNYVREAKIYGGSIVLWGVDASENVFEDIEVVGGYLRLGPGSLNKFINSAFCQTRASSGGSHYIDPNWYAKWTSTVFWESEVGGGNYFKNVVFDLLPRFTPILDPNMVLLEGCWFNGENYPPEPPPASTT